MEVFLAPFVVAFALFGMLGDTTVAVVEAFEPVSSIEEVAVDRSDANDIEVPLPRPNPRRDIIRVPSVLK